MKHASIKSILASDEHGHEAQVKGWVRTFRNNQFIALNDGSSLANLQLVVNQEELTEAELKRITTGACIAARGKILESQGRGQKYEMAVQELTVLGDSDATDYPLQPKKHSWEFLRDIAHLRFRTNTFGAIFRIRHALSFAVHDYFNRNGFFYLHSPIVTASDAEGAGEMFRVTTLDLNNPPKADDGKVDDSQDFFGKATNLTVSGQLEAELAALALGKVYTFGPTFRAENSNTSRHLAEFWMIEPEMAFADLTDNMDVAEELLKHCLAYVLQNCQEDLNFLNDRFIKEESQKPATERMGMSLIEKIEFSINQPFERLTYTEAIDVLKNSKPNKKKKFKYLIEDWGADLQSEHERYLVEKEFKKPVILTDYPRDIKAFYMRQNEDGRTVRAMDILFPGIGEIVGGSQREERLDHLIRRMQEMDIPTDEMSWYLDTRRFGTAPHSGFGLGFERLILFVTGMSNIRDVIPFPRTPGNARF